MDDCTLSTEAYDGDTDEDVVNRHIEHCEIFLSAATTMNIQFKLAKSKFAQEYMAARIESWPAPSSLDDVASFRAYCNYVREFIPSFSTLEAPLRPYMRKGAKFQEYLNDSAATGTFKKLKTALATEVGLATLDYTAASDAASGRPIELRVDASDIAWAATLAQKSRRDGPLRPVAVVGSASSLLLVRRPQVLRPLELAPSLQPRQTRVRSWAPHLFRRH